MQFIAILKLFAQLYPMLKELFLAAEGRVIEFRIDQKTKKIEAIFNDKETSAQGRAANLDDIFRK